ncbi:pulmonary surfactant-associated protein B-like [Alligator sinensis]|uniref:Pulmonary surfactant-associated protein B-like n=1 Tax=Alligator sinensis TaxID=38654 RepID=A0A1U7S8U6_ALLSI|nr:pulmonary surfactant-associated protein B-like [Alligator sinensis]XP_006031238.1 pulmonary surfactant-associated protein B-like [Alligator sinensis]XP_006031239.1 pulmonary surfactant-associated protein B-like [Alligator sinensis]
MALALIVPLVLAVATASAQLDQVPERCLQGPAYWCQDAETATECRKEQFCLSFWDTVLWDRLEEGALIPKPKKLCTLCTKVMQQLQSMVGEDADEDTIQKALKTVCKGLGRRLVRQCRSLVRKYEDQISDALQNGSDPQDTCTDLGLCSDSRELLDDLS